MSPYWMLVRKWGSGHCGAPPSEAICLVTSVFCPWCVRMPFQEVLDLYPFNTNSKFLACQLCFDCSSTCRLSGHPCITILHSDPIMVGLWTKSANHSFVTWCFIVYASLCLSGKAAIAERPKRPLRRVPLSHHLQLLLSPPVWVGPPCGIYKRFRSKVTFLSFPFPAGCNGRPLWVYPIQVCERELGPH